MPLENIEADLESIQKAASAANQEKEISGVLIYRDGFFLQRIEGEKAPLKKLYETIQLDDRHSHLKAIDEGEIEERLYKDWTQMQLITKQEDLKPLSVFFALMVEKGARATSEEDNNLAIKFIEDHAYG